MDQSLNRVVAVKVLAPQLAASDSARPRFLREARSSAAVRHENVVQIYAVEEDPLPHLVMEFLSGETLQQRLDRTGRLEASEVVEIGRQVANGLAAAHAIGLIHRDVKPANVFLEKVDGEPEGVSPRTGDEQQVRGLTPSGSPGPCSVKLLDFGLARAVDDVSITQSGMILGTPLYMSPEQARSEPVDQRADLFSLGSVLYALLAGDSPFRANGTLPTLKRLSEESPRPLHEVNPATPRWLSDLIAKLLAKNPDDRIGSAREVSALLARGSEFGPISRNALASDSERRSTVEPDASAFRLKGRVSRRTRVACAAFAVVVLLGAIVFKLKTKNFELTVEIPDAAARQGQETGHHAKQPTMPSVELTTQQPGDVDPERRAVQLLRAWDSPPQIVLSTGEYLEPHTPRDQPLPKTPFKIREMSFSGPDVERLGDGLADALVEPLRGVRVEQVLIVNSSKLTSAGLAKLVRLPAFERVSLLNLKGDKLDDGLFAEVVKLPKLTNLDLVACRQVTGKGLSALQSLNDFAILTTVDCSVSAEGLRELRTLPHLQYLNLSATKLTDVHVDELAATSIKDLILGATGLDDLQVERLLRNPSLSKLVLAGNDKITDKLLPTLKRHSQLRHLDLSSTSVTEPAAIELQQALPDCKVFWQAKPQP